MTLRARPRKSVPQMIQWRELWRRTIDKSRWILPPRLPIIKPRAGVLTSAPKGVTRLQSGEGRLDMAAILTIMTT